MRLLLTHTGRSLLAIYFILPGIMKFVSWDNHIALMEKHQMMMIPLLLAAAGVIEIAAGACLLLNRFVPACSLGLACLVLVINICLHDFWNFSGLDGAHEMQNFIKNLAIFAGLLLLASMNIKDAENKKKT